MTIRTAANDAPARPAGHLNAEEQLGLDLPEGHVGPVLLSGTGRTVWWTGRVAIGLRYQPPHFAEPYGQSALWVQDVLLRCG